MLRETFSKKGNRGSQNMDHHCDITVDITYFIMLVYCIVYTIYIHYTLMYTGYRINDNEFFSLFFFFFNNYYQMYT